MDELPTKYDIVVIGTGMTGSIIAAAASRIGKSVLHIDENEYYGEDWASFNLEALESWLKRNATPPQPPVIEPSSLLTSSERFVVTSHSCLCKNIRQEWKFPKGESEGVLDEGVVQAPEITVIEDGSKESSAANKTDSEKVGVAINASKGEEWTEDKLRSEYRKFNLDISPKMLYSRGPLVELLISSNIARYAEFKSVSRVLTWRNNRLEIVPSSRADVFATKHVTVVQKRMLVKVLSVFADYPASKDEFEGYEEKTFIDYLKHKKLPEQLIHYIVYSIAMGSDTTPCIQGVLACQRFLLSLGRYGNTPFIFPMYGSGELPQCFCRLCAVFGGVYHLSRPVDGFIVNEEGNAVAIVTGGQRLEAAQFVVSSAVCPDQFLAPDTSPAVCRGIFIADRSIADSEVEAITLLQFPPDKSHGHPVTVFEAGSSCHVCPKGLFLVHMTTECNSIDHVEKALFGGSDAEDELLSGGSHPKVLWSLKWSSMRGSQVTTSRCPPNLKVFCGPDPGLDFDVEVQRAKEIFQELCPNEEFLPRAPDPEEIVMDDPEPADHSRTEESSENRETDNITDAARNADSGDTNSVSDEGKASADEEAADKAAETGENPDIVDLNNAIDEESEK